jgi:Tfp pilus assembly protein PilN
MSTLTTSRVATLPRVNLLPPEIEEKRQLKRLQVGLGAGVVAVAGVVGALTLLANAAVNDANAELQTAQQRGAQLTAQQAEFAEVPLVYAQVEAATLREEQAMGQEVRWSRFLNDLSLSVPGKVWLTSMTVSQNVDAGTGVVAAPAAPGTSAYMQTGLGSITFEGKGYTHNDVASWLNVLAKQQGLTQPYFTNSQEEAIGSTPTVTFSSQATITEEALERSELKAGN